MDMKQLGSAVSDDELRAEAALRALSAVVGTSPRYAPVAGPSAMPMHLGLDSQTFVVERDGQTPATFLKLGAGDGLDAIDIDATAAASRQAAALSIAPALLAHDAGTQALLYEMLPEPHWRMARRSDLDSSTVMAAWLAAKRRWHESALLSRTRSPFEWAESQHEGLVRVEGERAKAGQLPIAPGVLPTLADCVARIKQAFDAAGSDLAPIHGEPAVSNLLLGPDGDVRLVDFDRAVNSDPHYDLAGTCLECCSFDDEIVRLVELYLGRTDPRVVARVQLYMIVDDFAWACWGLVAHQRSRRTSVEFYKYSRSRFLRCHYWICRSNMQELMSSI